VEKEKREQIIAAIEHTFKSIGAESLDDAGATIQKLSDFLSLKVKPLMSREHLDALLTQADIKAEDEEMLVALFENLPSVIGMLLNMISSEAAKTFPLANIGRPKSLSSEKRRSVCANIAQLHGQGTNLKVAKTRTAQKFGISMSTVERIWAERKKGHKPSVTELIDFLKKPQELEN
jgi:hypothetical protein